MMLLLSERKNFPLFSFRVLRNDIGLQHLRLKYNSYLTHFLLIILIVFAIYFTTYHEMRLIKKLINLHS